MQVKFIEKSLLNGTNCGLLIALLTPFNSFKYSLKYTYFLIDYNITK